jgi:D-alanyl-D-alanine dipeptidase
MGAFDAARAAPWQWLATRGCYDRTMRTFRPCFAFLALLALTPPAAAAERLPEDFVYLRDVDPSIAQDMRYAGSDNFTGHPLPGYDAGECVLRREVAQALAQVQADLARENLSLKVYDCYRPTRAVHAFARWALGADDGATKRFYPAMEKRTLFASGYIAAHSAHSTGSAVDLTLIPLGASPTVRSRESGNPGQQTQALPAASGSPLARGRTENQIGPCTATADKREHDDSLDMGTGFDCFDARSATASRANTPAQQRWRALLVAAMRAHGLHNYFREWWHFSFGPRAGPAYDFAIEARGAR